MGACGGKQESAILQATDVHEGLDYEALVEAVDKGADVNEIDEVRLFLLVNNLSLKTSCM
eukprot:SAG31_NODE_6877_length_1862_cov_3.511061_2_plen_60_part_00